MAGYAIYRSETVVIQLRFDARQFRGRAATGRLGSIAPTRRVSNAKDQPFTIYSVAQKYSKAVTCLYNYLYRPRRKPVVSTDLVYTVIQRAWPWGGGSSLEESRE